MKILLKLSVILLSTLCCNFSEDDDNSISRLNLTVQENNDYIFSDGISMNVIIYYKDNERLFFKENIVVSYNNGTWIPEKKVLLTNEDYYLYAILPYVELYTNTTVLLNIPSQVEYYFNENIPVINKDNTYANLVLSPLFQSKIRFRFFTDDLQENHHLNKIILDRIGNNQWVKAREISITRNGDKNKIASLDPWTMFEGSFLIPQELSQEEYIEYIIPHEGWNKTQNWFVFTIDGKEYKLNFIHPDIYEPGKIYNYNFLLRTSKTRNSDFEIIQVIN